MRMSVEGTLRKSMTEQRAFIAGATGHTGRALVEACRRAGAHVVAHIRPGSSSLQRLGPRFEELGAVLDTTAWEPAALRDTLAGHRPTQVFALLGTTRKRASAEGMGASEGYEKIDYGLSVMLIDAVADACPDARLVYLSAVGVREGTSNPYMRARARVETHLHQSSLEWTIVRPAMITGDREESRLAESVGGVVGDALLSVAGFFGAHRIQDRYASITGSALAEGLARVASDPQYAHQTVHGEALR